MRVIKLAIISFIFLFLLVTIISLFIPSHVKISRAVNVKAERDSIMEQFRDPAKWKNWHPGLDSASLLIVDGRPKGVILDSSNKENPLTIVLVSQDSSEVIAEFKPKKLRPVKNGWKTISYAQSDSVTVQWYMDFHLRWYPWEKFGSLLLERSHGTKMEQGLTNLRNFLHRKQ